jgi:hypothetical protein
VNIKRTLYLSLGRVIASLVTVQQSPAQAPCNPKLFPSARFFVNWPQFQYATAQTGCNPYESVLNSSNIGCLATKGAQAAGEVSYTSAVVRRRRLTIIPQAAPSDVRPTTEHRRYMMRSHHLLLQLRGSTALRSMP